MDVSEVLPGKTHLFKGWAVAKAAVTRPLLGLVFDKIQRARVCPLAVTGLISSDVVFPWAWDRRGLCQARLSKVRALPGKAQCV